MEMQREVARSGSVTITITPEQAEPRVLSLTLQPRKPKKKVQWNDNVVDNENLGRKRSNICCIYHKPRSWDDSDSEDSDIDDPRNEYELPPHRCKRGHHNGHGDHEHHNHKCQQEPGSAF
jgi:protein phosphatase 1 regulatory subunit 11